MNITKQNSDALNAVVKVDIVAEDYQAKVSKFISRITVKRPTFLVLEKDMCQWV